MAVLLENDMGCFICHKTFINSCLEKCVCDSQQIKLKIKVDFFEINTPFLMSSKALKGMYRQYTAHKKQKNEAVPSTSGNYHNEVGPLIAKATCVLLDKLKRMGYLKVTPASPEEWLTNNKCAKAAAKHILKRNSYQNPPDLVATYKNDTALPVIKEGYVIPPFSSCVLSDITEISNLFGNCYDVILFDPPWENKSVKRKKGYKTIKFDDLLHIPVPQLIKPGSLVIVWATNSNKQIKFIKETLFHSWGLDHQADWHWVKVTSRGEYVYPLDSPHEKPYENLIIGRMCQRLDEAPIKLPDHKVIVSIPSSIHSHKPPLSELLKPYLPPNPKCLEIFAKYMLPGWASFGYEVLRLQTVEMFDIVPLES